MGTAPGKFKRAGKINTAETHRDRRGDIKPFACRSRQVSLLLAMLATLLPTASEQAEAVRQLLRDARK